MTWARRLKRVFKIDIEQCVHCGTAVKIIACIQDPNVIGRILERLKRTSALGTGAAFSDKIELSVKDANYRAERFGPDTTRLWPRSLVSL